MKGIGAKRIKIRVGDLWESPLLHVLMTKEDDVIVARCLDFTVSSHGKDEKDALKSMAEAVKEYILTAVENDAIDTIFDPAHGKYWRSFNELEAKQLMSNMKRSLRRSFKSIPNEHIQKSITEISYDLPADIFER